MKKTVEFDKSKKVFPLILMIIGAGLMAAQLITRLNFVAVLSIGYCCIVSAVMLLSLIFKKRVYLFMALGYAFSFTGLTVFHIIFGADAGFGAFSSGLAGWSSAEHTLSSGEGNVLLRLCGNLLLSLPVIISFALLLVFAKKSFKKGAGKKALGSFFSLHLVASAGSRVLFSNLRKKPVTQRLWEGEEDYLKGVDQAPKDSPNVLFILMDDLGYGDVSLNGSIYETPNIDSIGENGLNFENFYSSYSVCSPARFAAMTGRYPYRGYADNVVYPTISTVAPFAETRIFNSIEMGNNVDGMLGDEITVAEVFKSAGYSTGLFGKWHLGDYGEYLPTNQGFDYFYGSHHVNDMKPFYHVREQGGEYTIVRGTDELKDQSKATEWINEEITDWITQTVTEKDEPFFAVYTSPWPHAPVFVGDEFKGSTGMGTYVDCINEFDAGLGKLFGTLEDLGVLEDTIIVFTSDNGPALEGSVNELRGGKYLAYEGGQKVPFMLRWDNNNGLFKAGEKRSQSATLVDLFPTLLSLCSITGDGKSGYLPADRVIDGVSMLPVIENDSAVHTEEKPILHMKRKDIKAIQYTVDTADVKKLYPDYNYSVLNDNEQITFKYFDRIQNDNSAFFDKYRKNWLHILTDDSGENYNRSGVYPLIADEMHAKLDEIQKDFESNPRGIIK